MIEPYQKGTPFTHWAERLHISFMANKVPENEHKAYFLALCGPYLYAELKLLFPMDSLIDIPLATMIAKLKERIDVKATSGTRHREGLQTAEQSVEDFLLALKFHGELCECGLFTNPIVRDHLLTVLNETDQTLKSSEKIVRMWLVAKRTFQSIIKCSLLEQISSLVQPVERLLSLSINNALRQQGNQQKKIPIKERLGFQPYNKYCFEQRDSVGVEPKGPQEYHPKIRGRKYFRICFFCGKLGHVQRRCFELKNMKKNVTRLVEQMEPTSAEKQNVKEPLIRDRAEETDSDSDPGGNWKRGYSRLLEST